MDLKVYLYYSRLAKTRNERSYLVESDQVTEFSEASSAHHHLVFTDDTLSGETDSAASRVFTIVSGMGSEKLVGHYELRIYA